MTLAQALREAKAIDARGGGDVADVLRARELDEVFSQIVDAEPTEQTRSRLARIIVRKLRAHGGHETPD